MAKRERRLLRVEGEGDDDFPSGIIGIQERAAGTGSIDTVTINGYTYYRGRYWCENAKGVRERKTVYASTKEGVELKIRRLKNTPAVKGEIKKLTLAQFLEDRFLPGIESKVRLSTSKTYGYAVRTHIIPRIGKGKFAALTPANVDAWITELTKDPKVGARVAQQAFAVLRRAYAYAVDLGLVDRNPVATLKAPKVKRKEMHILSLGESGKLLKTASESEWYTLVYLAIATSMRQGELFGLQWKNVHLDKGYLRVVQTLGIGENDEPVLGEPKTESSRRRVDLSPEAIQVLKRHRATQKGKPNPHDLVFPSDHGGFIRKSNFRRRDWLPLLKKAKLPAITFHSLRHVGNSILAQQGVPLKALQARLGHSTSKVTFDTYTHLAPSDTALAAKTMGRLLPISGLKNGLNRSKKATDGEARQKKKAR